MGLYEKKNGVWVKVAEGAAAGGGSGGLPTVTERDNGKFLGVVNGVWTTTELPRYDGAYTVIPSATDAQTLETAKTYLDADVKIEKIPYAEVSNAAGGTTITIGGDA